MKRTTSIRIPLICMIVVVFAAGFAHAQTNPYVEALFAPPSEQELAAAYGRMNYAPVCNEFKIGDAFLETSEYVIYKVTYISDGLKQTGLIGWPKTGVPAGGRFPLAMLDHAGFGGISSFDIPLMKQFLQRGYAIAMATYRGEAGIAGAAEGKMDILGDEAHDIMNLMECAAKNEKVDPARIVAWSASHGGGLTMNILTHTDRIKAASFMSAPISLLNVKIKSLATRWRSQPSSVEVTLNMLMPKEGIAMMKQILGIKSNDPAGLSAARLELLRRSPTLFADKINTPIVMYFGEKDPVTFSGDGRIVVASLQRRGISAKLTSFENLGHAISPKEAEKAKLEILDFFDSYIKK